MLGIIGAMDEEISIIKKDMKNIVEEKVILEYGKYNSLAYPLVLEKVKKSNNKRKDGSDRKPSFVYVDDRIVKKAMELHWGITVRNGIKQKNGINGHAWQALGAVTYYLFGDKNP